MHVNKYKSTLKLKIQNLLFNELAYLLPDLMIMFKIQRRKKMYCHKIFVD